MRSEIQEVWTKIYHPEDKDNGQSKIPLIDSREEKESEVREKRAKTTRYRTLSIYDIN